MFFVLLLADMADIFSKVKTLDVDMSYFECVITSIFNFYE